MNRVVTTDASITAGQPIVANNGLGTLPFIQDSFQEAMANFVKGVLGTYIANDLIVLVDPIIVISGGGSNTATWTAGAFFYNNEIYTIPAGTLTKISGVFLYIITDVQSPVIDPVYYKDGTQHGPHRVRQITISSGTSGTGIADYGASTVKNLRGDYTDATPLHGWVNTDTFGNKGKYKKAPFGYVELNGYIGGDAINIPSSPIIFTLPAGYRPTHIRIFIALGTAPTGTTGAFSVKIDTNGDVSFLEANRTTPAFDASSQVFLTGIRFNTAD